MRFIRYLSLRVKGDPEVKASVGAGIRRHTFPSENAVASHLSNQTGGLNP